MAVKSPVPDSAPQAPPALALLSEWPRAAWTVGSLAFSGSLLNAAPVGDGRPVVVLPGLFNSDRSNFVLLRYLRRLGYRAEGWGLGRNLGRRVVGDDCAVLFDRMEETAGRQKDRLTLIGVSLGGIMARLVAQRRPDLVREVITVSSPFAGSPSATNVWRAFEWITGDKISDPAVLAMQEEVAAPLPVPATAIWSASDGLVNGMICRADDPGCRNVEVRSSHLGVQLKPEVLRAIADVLGGVEPQVDAAPTAMPDQPGPDQPGS
ncbi:alpha/beta fold hydrolase [Stakelama marina]|uniref:alpha/beta fold hydrolase n=1 Tax=Stakelama marina TaxID=2826939 RepID=UPI0024C470F2|nr:alpha/beta fold hydrolase [Stakelama marina]